MSDDTARIARGDDSTAEHVRRLGQQIGELTDSLRASHEMLRGQGMSLSSRSVEGLRALAESAERFSQTTGGLHHELRHLRALAETTALINSLLDVSEVLTRVMDTVILLTGAERGFIMLRDPATGGLTFTIARGIDQAQLEQKDFSVSSTIINEVANTGLPVLTDNARSDPRYQSNDSIVGFALRSIIAVPLKVRGEVIGVVYCDNRFFAGLFKQHDLDIVSAFANQAAVAIHNAHLYQSARDRLAEIKQRSDLLSNVLESIASGVITTDSAGIIHTCNAAAEAILGCAADSLIDLPLADALPTDLGDAFYERLEAVRQTGVQALVKAEPTLPGGLGRRHWNLIVSPLRDYSGQMQGLALVIDDLTDIRHRETQLTEVRRYLPLALVEQIRAVDMSDVGGQERFISAIFADVRGFTSFSERLDPELLMDIINKFLSLAGDAINLYEGVVDKYMGDAVTGLFNTQLNPQEDHAVRAVRAAMTLRYDLFALHEVLPEDQHLLYKVGIHSGLAVLGNVGSPDRKEFTAIGEAVEISKIMEENAQGGEIVISAATYALVADHFACEPFTPTRTRGRTDIAVAYRVLHQIAHD